MLEPGQDSAGNRFLREGIAFLQAGNYSAAEACFRDNPQDGPVGHMAHYYLGVALAHQGRAAAAAPYLKDALLNGDFQPPHWKFAFDVLKQSGDLEGQAALYRRLSQLQPENAAAHYNLGNALRVLRRYDEAEAAWRATLNVRPDFAEAHNNLGTLAKMRGDLALAATEFRAAIAAMPDFSAAHRNFGTVLEQLGDLGGAERAYRRSLALEPNSPETLRYLGGVLFELGQASEALKVFLSHAGLRYGSGDAQLVPDANKQAHDAEQQAWLGVTRNAFDKLSIVGGERISTGTINCRDDAKIADGWAQNRPQVVVIDDFLNPEALAALRKFCLESTIWRQSFPGGYLGSLPEHGFAVPLLAQLTEELSDAYPTIFASHPLLQLWAFKYGPGPAGIRLHADFAAVNVNFWITPDDANKDPESGGLVIWDKAAPADWDFKKYNNDEKAMRAFLASAGARAIKVPYRSNRAVIFDSNLFHETDRIDFRDGYENRRINITLLYGWRSGERRTET